MIQSLEVASAGPEKHIPTRGKGQMNTIPEMKTVWGETAPNVTKSFGDEWDQEETKVRRWVTGIGPQHPKDFVV